VDVVLGIEARGFIFAPALAYALGAGFVPVRKPKKLPAETVSVTYDLEYGTDTLEMHKDASRTAARVLIVDDLLATGGTAAAAARMVNRPAASGRFGIRGRAYLPPRARQAGRPRGLLAAPVRQMSLTAGRVCAHSPRSTWSCACWPSGPTATTSCAPFSHISLADSIDIAFTPRGGPSSSWDDLHLDDNLAARAARVAMDAMRLTGHVEMRSRKRIPMGAGLGGGSSDAPRCCCAAVLAGRGLAMDRLRQLGEQLGSDVPFFLLGGPQWA